MKKLGVWEVNIFYFLFFGLLSKQNSGNFNYHEIKLSKLMTTIKCPNKNFFFCKNAGQKNCNKNFQPFSNILFKANIKKQGRKVKNLPPHFFFANISHGRVGMRI